MLASALASTAQAADSRFKVRENRLATAEAVQTTAQRADSHFQIGFERTTLGAA